MDRFIRIIHSNVMCIENDGGYFIRASESLGLGARMLNLNEQKHFILNLCNTYFINIFVGDVMSTKQSAIYKSII